jgi:two-component system chemotaxis response regulator CheY
MLSLTQRRHAQRGGPPAPADGAPRILIVDDSAFARYSLKQILTKSGYHVVEADDGGSAIELYAGEKPDAVLLDITMERVDGLSTLRAIRQMNPQAKVAMVTGLGQQSIVLEAVKSGASDFIVKPFQPDRVLSALEKLLAVG